MSSFDPMSALTLASDAELVAACRTGDRDAFGQIVERYQRLLCSLAYSSTGRLSHSEDLAQEAFVEAWRQLPKLREPDKLRPWLCGILRFKVSRLRRSDDREPVHQADSLDDVGDLVSDDESAPDRTIQAEEQAIMWNALERVPEVYREPLVLYYREHRSIEHVAAALDLTEDAVKQRLSRGRRILQERVLAFVEGALARSTPGKVFTLGVLAALPELATPAKAAGIGAAAVASHGGVLAKSTTLAALLASVSGLVSAVLALRASLDQSRTPAERRAVVKVTLVVCATAFGLLGMLYGLRASAYRWWEYRMLFAGVSQVLVVAFAFLWPLGLLKALRRSRALRTAERQRHPEAFTAPRDQVGSVAGEYRSQWRLLGVPLVHVRFATADAGQGPVFGWFAGGDRAYGLLCAWGALAVAPLSVGAVSVGVLSVGSVSVGVISLGTVAIGGLVVGCATIGVKAFAWLSALGWHSAQGGGFGIARLAAEAPVAWAQHANDPAARALLADPNAERTQMIFLAIIATLTLVPVIAYARAVRQRLG